MMSKEAAESLSTRFLMGLGGSALSGELSAATGSLGRRLPIRHIRRCPCVII